MEFLVKEMDYCHYIMEKDNGLSASAIFYKKDKFDMLEKGHLCLDYSISMTAVTNEKD